MRYFRQSHHLRSLLSVVLVAVFLRSFIAPGFMLKASTEDGLGIIFCNGPVSMVVLQDEHSGHHRHGDEDAQKETHISPICSQWSTSSVLVFNSLIEPLDLDVHRTEFFYHYSPPFLQHFSKTDRITRGPPVYS